MCCLCCSLQASCSILVITPSSTRSPPLAAGSALYCSQHCCLDAPWKQHPPQTTMMFQPVQAAANLASPSVPCSPFVSAHLQFNLGLVAGLHGGASAHLLQAVLFTILSLAASPVIVLGHVLQSPLEVLLHLNALALVSIGVLCLLLLLHTTRQHSCREKQATILNRCKQVLDAGLGCMPVRQD